MNYFENFRLESCFRVKIEKLLLRKIVFSIFIILCLGVGITHSAQTELTKVQAIARVRVILRGNTSACRINKIRSITAARVKTGWRVTARLTMSASGRPVSETAVWIVGKRNGATAQNQLTAEIASGCP